MLNRVDVMGRIATDLLDDQTSTGVRAISFRIAIPKEYKNEQGKREADFFSANAWGSTAEFIANHFIKGDRICLTGKLMQRTWTDSEGSAHSGAEIRVDKAYFCDGKRM